MNNQNFCPNHPEKQGQWKCSHCNILYCENCIHITETAFGKVFSPSLKYLERAKEKNKKLTCNTCYFNTRKQYAKTLVVFLAILFLFEIVAFIYSYMEDEFYRSEWTFPLFALTILSIAGCVGFWHYFDQKSIISSEQQE